jgi:hypothetical protein
MKRIIPVLFAVLCMGTANAPASQGAYDVSSLCLNSLAIDPGQQQVTLTFGVEARKAANSEQPVDVQASIKKAVEYFFLGLALPDDKFWVDLNPSGLTQVMDNDLAGTGLGRILLAADLRLKKDMCELTNPRKSKPGRMYWDRLYAKADELGVPDQLPVFNRVWIRPGEVKLVRTSHRIAIARSALQVCFEDNLDAHADAKAKQLQEYAGSLMRELIIPELNARVNESLYYADLRQVFSALILARQYRENAGRTGASAGFGDQVLRDLNPDAVLKDAEKSRPLDKDNIYRAYIDSLKKGEYNFQENVSGRLHMYMEVITRQYMSGGINLKKIKMESSDTADREANGTRSEGVFKYSFDITFAAGTVRPLAAAIQQLAEKFNNYNMAREIAAGFSADDLPSTEPRSSLNTVIGQQHINSQRMLSNL